MILVDLILLLSRNCHQHQLGECYSCSLICMFLYICFSSCSSTTEFTAMECDVSAYVILTMCNSSCFLHKVHQFQPICYYQSVWRGGGWSRRWSRAVCSVGVFFTSFRPSLLFEEMGDDLEDISDVEIQIESFSFTKITRSTRRKPGVRSARSEKSTRSGYTYSWWGKKLLGSCVDYFNREREEFQYGLFQSGKEKWIMMSNSTFYMGYLDREEKSWSFCTNVTGGKWLMQSLMWEEFLGSNVDC